MLAGYELYSGTEETGGGNGHNPYRPAVDEVRLTPIKTQTHVSEVAASAEQFHPLGTPHTSERAQRVTSDDLGALQRQITYLREEVASLQERIKMYAAAEQATLGDAGTNPVAMFILSKIADRGCMDLDVLNENLVPPAGWIAFAQLWRANLIDCIGKNAFPTDAGNALLSWLAEQREDRRDTIAHR